MKTVLQSSLVVRWLKLIYKQHEEWELILIQGTSHISVSMCNATTKDSMQINIMLSLKQCCFPMISQYVYRKKKIVSSKMNTENAIVVKCLFQIPQQSSIMLYLFGGSAHIIYGFFLHSHSLLKHVTPMMPFHSFVHSPTKLQ